MIDTIVKKSVSDNWGLFKLKPRGASLEETFMRLTHGDIEQLEKNNIK